MFFFCSLVQRYKHVILHLDPARRSTLPKWPSGWRGIVDPSRLPNDPLEKKPRMPGLLQSTSVKIATPDSSLFDGMIRWSVEVLFDGNILKIMYEANLIFYTSNETCSIYSCDMRNELSTISIIMLSHLTSQINSKPKFIICCESTWQYCTWNQLVKKSARALPKMKDLFSWDQVKF